MKSILLLFVAILATGSAAPVDDLRKLILELRDRMPCGFPEFDLPPLAPFLLDHLEIDSNGIFAIIDDLELKGLNSFEIDSLDLSILVFRVAFKLTFEEIALRTDYFADIDLGGLNIEGLSMMPKIFGQGDINLALRNLSFTGGMQLQFDEEGRSSLRNFNIALDLDEIESKITGMMNNEIVNNFINDVLMSAVMTFTKEMKEFVSDTLDSLMVPIVNSLLVNVTRDTILGWITGGGGGGSGGEPEPEKPICVPPVRDLLSLLRRNYY